MEPFCALGDTSTHGGVVVTASTDMHVDGRRVALNGDILACPIHGPSAIIATTVMSYYNGIKITRNNDPTTCGAAIVTQQHYWKTD